MPVCSTRNPPICYERQGDPTAPVVVLIMGFSMQMIAWPQPLIDRLVTAGLQVLRFDNRDIGLSGRMVGRPNVRRMVLRRLFGLPVHPPYSLRDMAQDLRHLMDELGLDRAHIVGASMGGMIAQWLAIDAPQRVASLCSMMSTTGQLRYAFPAPSLIPLIVNPPGDTLESRLEHGVRFWQAVASPADPPSAEEIREQMREYYERSADLSGRDRQLAAVLGERSRVPLLRQLHCPTLVLHGDADRLIRAAAGRATAKAIPGARLHIIPGMGHDLRPGLIPHVADRIIDHVRRADSTRVPGHL